MCELPPLKVYYDGICPGCRRDRARYERWAGEAGRQVTWCDVTEYQATLREKGVDPQAALLSLHVEEEGGRIEEGIDAYVLLMRRVPRLKPLAWLIGLPGLKPALRWCYDRWVRKRLAREGRLP
ncbi:MULTISPECIES: DCC1-like thiol-disulfide oxidoreductase family protein [unclassified Halomonas]|uniref:thiol-disulfide oxidoreductase DCC family protein n=1 Tax=unclassified Halomonas TaxID=2609666 RepID=UPI0024693297|nr:MULTISPECIES: DCC1-like thiol-disulfide oxidoreductase family protein [unclassified Halomonas]